MRVEPERPSNLQKVMTNYGVLVVKLVKLAFLEQKYLVKVFPL
jgi:hypothetical protein